MKINFERRIANFERVTQKLLEDTFAVPTVKQIKCHSINVKCVQLIICNTGFFIEIRVPIYLRFKFYPPSCPLKEGNCRCDQCDLLSEKLLKPHRTL